MFHRWLIITFFTFCPLLSFAADDFSITSNLPQQAEYYFASSSMLTLQNIHGTCNPMNVQSVYIMDKPAFLQAGTGDWRIADNDSIHLNPGINRITIKTFSNPSGTGTPGSEGYIDVWYDRGQHSELSGIINNNTTLAAANGPWYITGEITIPSGITLEIQAGTTLFFQNGSRATIQQGGCLVAIGTISDQIYLTRHPEQSSRWRGIRFEQSTQDNIFSYVVMTFGDSASQMISVDQSRLTIDHMHWGSFSDKTILEVHHPQIHVSHSNFPSTEGVEGIHGADLSGTDYLILENNIFHPTTGYNDIIDFSNCKRPGPILEVYNNTFLGGSDDGLDLDGCDAHIEGNIFQNFHKGHSGSSTSNAIATGEYNGRTTDLVVVRNIFTNNDHAILLKEGCYMDAENNVFARSDIAAINFGEPERGVTPGKGAYFTGDIFFQNTATFENLAAQAGETNPEIAADRCIIESAFQSLGSSNMNVDPQFQDPENDDFKLEPESPARKSGPNGLDMGAFVPAGASISGEPSPITSSTSAVLQVGGPGITSYRYCLNDTLNTWTEEFDLATHPEISLENLTNGQTYRVYVQGKNSAGRWQQAPNYTVSKSWKVDITANVFGPSRQHPLRFELSGYPNPFNPLITLTYTLPNANRTQVTICDITGRMVTILYRGFQNAGIYSIRWNGTDMYGLPAASGMYMVSLKSGNQLKVKKIILLR